MSTGTGIRSTTSSSVPTLPTRGPSSTRTRSPPAPRAPSRARGPRHPARRPGLAPTRGCGPRRRSDSLQPGRDALADLVRRILLDEVAARDLDLGLVGPFAADFAHRPAQDRPGLGIDEELGEITGGEPGRVVGRDGHHVFGLSRDGDLPGPGEGGPPALPGFEEGAPVLGHQFQQCRTGRHFTTKWVFSRMLSVLVCVEPERGFLFFYTQSQAEVVKKIEKSNDDKNQFVKSYFILNPVVYFQNKINSFTKTDYYAYKSYRKHIQSIIDKKIDLILVETWNNVNVNKGKYNQYVKIFN